MSGAKGPDPYLDPASGVLRNLLGITDSGELAQVEAALSASRLIDLERQRLPGIYDLARAAPVNSGGNTGLISQLIAKSEVPTDTPHMATCGRPRKSDGRPCERLVRRPGMACRDHGGPGALRHTPRPRPSQQRSPSSAASRALWQRAVSSPPGPASSWQPPLKPSPVRPARPPRLRARERERVKDVAEFCADVLADGSWEQEVADRLADQAGDAWERLKRNRRRRNCKKLAQMARTILNASPSFQWMQS